jgi:hypothetical protein
MKTYGRAEEYLIHFNIVLPPTSRSPYWFLSFIKVAGSIPDKFIEFFTWPNPSSRTMALRSTQPLTEMSTRNLHGRKGRPVRGADNLTANCEATVWKMWEPRRLIALWAFIACCRDSFTFTLPL